jgi:hypothetical protein
LQPRPAASRRGRGKRFVISAEDADELGDIMASTPHPRLVHAARPPNPSKVRTAKEWPNMPLATTREETDLETAAEPYAVELQPMGGPELRAELEEKWKRPDPAKGSWTNYNYERFPQIWPAHLPPRGDRSLGPAPYLMTSPADEGFNPKEHEMFICTEMKELEGYPLFLRLNLAKQIEYEDVMRVGFEEAHLAEIEAFNQTVALQLAGCKKVVS